MPEGPEVRKNAEQLNSLLQGRFIYELRPTSGKLARLGIPAADLFKPSTVRKVEAKGKLICVQFESGATLTSTLGMSGWWYPGAAMVQLMGNTDKAYVGGKLVPLQSVIMQALKYSRVSIIGKDDQALAEYTDMRNFGNMEYWPDGLPDRALREKVGVDLMTVEFTEAAAAGFVKLKAEGKKSVLNMKMGDLALAQHIIAGLGNIYRAETFWLSGIDPHRKFGELTDDEWLRFIEIATVVLQVAYETGGVMRYHPDFITVCTGIPWPYASRRHAGHLAYGKATDIYGRAILRDTSFGRTLWRLA